MLEEFVGALPGMLAPALLVMTLSVLLGVGEGRDVPFSRQWRMYGLLIGLGAALVFTVLRVLVIVNRRSMVNLPVLIGCVVFDLLIVVAMIASTRLVRDWRRHGVWLHAANAVSAIGIALTTFFASQDVFMQLTSFVETGESPFTSKMLLRTLGFVLGIGVAVLVAAIFRTMRTTAVRGSFLAASLLMMIILLVRHLTQLCSLLMSLMIVQFHGSVFRLLIVAANNGMKLVIASVLVFVIPAVASIVAGFRAPLTGSNGAVVREHKAFRRRAKAAGVWSLIVMVAVTFALTAGIAKIHEQPTLSPPEGYSQHNGVATIEFNKVDDGHLHRFEYKAKDGTVMRFIIIKKNGGSYGVGLDACMTCGDAGYYEKDGKIICKRCAVEMNVATIGFKGGCNPIPFPFETSHGKITIQTSDLDALSSHFKE